MNMKKQHPKRRKNATARRDQPYYSRWRRETHRQAPLCPQGVIRSRSFTLAPHCHSCSRSLLRPRTGNRGTLSVRLFRMLSSPSVCVCRRYFPPIVILWQKEEEKNARATLPFFLVTSRKQRTRESESARDSPPAQGPGSCQGNC